MDSTGINAVARGDDAELVLDALPVPVALVDRSGRVAGANALARRHPDLPTQLRDLEPGGRATVVLGGKPHDAHWAPHRAGWVVALADISAHADDRDRAETAARTDPLTGLANRAALRDDLTDRLRRAADEAADVAVLMIDLDRFKPVNDTLGHAVGDAVLRALAGRLRGAVRGGDGVFRLGGDEFAVVISDGDGGPSDIVGAADAMARRVVDLAGRSFLVEGQMARIGASVGVALSEGAVDPDSVLRRADIALYRAKEAGRSQHAHFEPSMDTALRERRDLELDLRRALALEQFELHYQPQFDLLNATVTGFEALIRWSRPAHGLVSPAAFIPVAEASGMIVPIGEWVLRAACREAAEWSAPLAVSVNASPAQFAAGDFVRTVRSALDRSGLDPRRLVIEITESTLLNEGAETMATLEGLRALGVRIAMDDFGTGCSSLSYLRSFPFDIVKVDQSFVRGSGERERREAIVRSVVALGREMGMEVTAEGVETMEQMEAIHRDGCAHAQGYLIGRPVPGSVARAMVEEMAAPASTRLLREADEVLAAGTGGPASTPHAAPAERSAQPVKAVVEADVEADVGTVVETDVKTGAMDVGEPAWAGSARPDGRERVDAPPLEAAPGPAPSKADRELYRLVYQSTCVLHETEASLLAEVDDILAVARHKNAALGITGALMFNGSHYAQVLEGERGAVERLFETINLDPRHADVALLSFEPVAERLFGNWSMAGVGARSGRMAELAELTGFDRDALEGDEMARRLHELLERDTAEA